MGYDELWEINIMVINIYGKVNGITFVMYEQSQNLLGEFPYQFFFKTKNGHIFGSTARSTSESVLFRTYLKSNLI